MVQKAVYYANEVRADKWKWVKGLAEFADQYITTYDIHVKVCRDVRVHVCLDD